MWTKKAFALVALCAFFALPAAQALAQQTQPSQAPPWYGPGPWWMDGYGWSLWWMCPVMMLVMLGVMAFMMLSRRHPGDSR